MGHHPPPSTAVNPFPPPPSLIPASCCSHVSRIRMKPNERANAVHFFPNPIFPILFLLLFPLFSFFLSPPPLSFHARKYSNSKIFVNEEARKYPRLRPFKLFNNSGNVFSSGCAGGVGVVGNIARRGVSDFSGRSRAHVSMESFYSAPAALCAAK